MGPPYRSTAQGRAESRLEDGIAASIAGGVIAASGKPHTVEEAIAVFQQVRQKLFPTPTPQG